MKNKSLEEKFQEWEKEEKYNIDCDVVEIAFKAGYELAQKENQKKINKLRKTLEDIETSGTLVGKTVQESSVLAKRESLEWYLIECNKLARKVLKEIE
jgi:hypothetical protein